MKTRTKLETDSAINNAVLNIIHERNVEDIFYIIEEFTSRAKEYAKEVKKDKDESVYLFEQQCSR